MSDKVIKVETWGEGQGDFVLIDADSFDEDFHTLIDDGTAQSGPKEGTAAFLRAKLDELGIVYKAGTSKSDLQALLDQADAATKLAGIKDQLTAKSIAFDDAETAEQLQAKLDAAQ